VAVFNRQNMIHFVAGFDRQNMIYFVTVFNRQNIIKYHKLEVNFIAVFNC